ncbi:MAG TPA: DegT/DnrJ/EryC1/StrS family aminotransferase [bacterium]
MPSGGVVIPHSRPSLSVEDFAAVAGVMRSGHLAQGEQVQQFEESVAASVGRRGGVATSSGTAALHLALLALGVGAGDEVIVPSYTCVALLHAVRYVGATPRLVDIEPDQYNISAHEIRQHLSPRIKAMIIPHMFGMPADLEPLASLGVPLIEDCAQSLGATYNEKPVGRFGIISICSFYATKVITTGEGGMLLSDSDFLLRRARDLRDYDGRAVHETRFNYKMTDLQAALGISQLRRLPSFLARRGALAARYAAALRDLPVSLPSVMAGRTHIFYRYVVGVDGAARLAHRLGMRGIQCKPPVFKPLHHCLGQEGFAHTDAAMQRALSIPLYPALTDEEADTVVREVSAAVVREEERPRQLLASRS